MDQQQQQMGVFNKPMTVGQILWLALGLTVIGIGAAAAVRAIFVEEWYKWLKLPS